MTATTTTTPNPPLPKLVSTTATSPFRPSATQPHSVLPHHPIHPQTQQPQLSHPTPLQHHHRQQHLQPSPQQQPQQPQQPQQQQHQQPQLQQQRQHPQQQQHRQQQQRQPQQQPTQKARSPPPPHLSNVPPPKPSTIVSPRPQPSQSDPVLPRGARVRISGNNRTKWDLIGRIGHVRAAQTLGGWHEVQLDDGGIVRVQRNALAVLELPPVDPSSLVRIESARRQNPLPLPASLKKRVRKPPRPSHANISKLNFASLKRYRTVYNLNVSSDCSRDELVGAVRKHFERTKVNESEVISNFLRHIARRGGPPASD